MGCTHPMGVERITRADGTPGIRCPVCGCRAYPDDSWWTTLKRALAIYVGKGK